MLKNIRALREFQFGFNENICPIWAFTTASLWVLALWILMACYFLSWILFFSPFPFTVSNFCQQTMKVWLFAHLPFASHGKNRVAGYNSVCIKGMSKTSQPTTAPAHMGQMFSSILVFQDYGTLTFILAIEGPKKGWVTAQSYLCAILNIYKMMHLSAVLLPLLLSQEREPTKVPSRTCPVSGRSSK